jgi:hypothetical protein
MLFWEEKGIQVPMLQVGKKVCINRGDRVIVSVRKP